MQSMLLSKLIKLETDNWKLQYVNVIEDKDLVSEHFYLLNKNIICKLAVDVGGALLF